MPWQGPGLGPDPSLRRFPKPRVGLPEGQRLAPEHAATLRITYHRGHGSETPSTSSRGSWAHGRRHREPGWWVSSGHVGHSLGDAACDTEEEGHQMTCQAPPQASSLSKSDPQAGRGQ